ncbi:hypothetical protein CBR_g37111 [Chara braunii]|uniref:Ammonium transporter n=1 Tax=Chara braunii TaxID=69332 RepID=A0A388LM62_CHABU|nr:hypothetical protein CBR_g37111 [Chara braunii]|eukprot:GBG83397.1 hypothetical protein CBR_g37111 [Chara braunii]
MAKVSSYFCGLDHHVNNVSIGADGMFLLFSAYLVFAMQAGFGMLCAGSVRRKNTVDIVLTHIMNAAVGAMSYYLVGFTFAFGRSSNGFIGAHSFAKPDDKAINPNAQPGAWLFQWTFAVAAASITTGSITERTQFTTYILCSTFLTAFVYPVVSHWVWAPSGWLSAANVRNKFLGVGMVDFAGSGVVHMTGAIAGFWGSWIEGPRIGRFDMRGNPKEMRGHSPILEVLGTLLLWFGWYGLTTGSVLATISPSGIANNVLVARTVITTTLAGGAASVTVLLARKSMTGHWMVEDACSGLIAGFTAVTAGCSVIEPWAAVVLGFLAAWVLIGMNRLALKIRYDDPLNAFQRHGGCGLLGIIFVGLLAKKEYLLQTLRTSDNSPYGLLYGGGGRLLAAQVTGAICITAWTSVTMGTLFYALNNVVLLRISEEEEAAGLDVVSHGRVLDEYRDELRLRRLESGSFTIRHFPGPERGTNNDSQRGQSMVEGQTAIES